MMVCGDPAAGPPYWGYTPGQPDVLKTSTSSGGNWEVGPGNFQLIRLGGGQGGAGRQFLLAVAPVEQAEDQEPGGNKIQQYPDAEQDDRNSEHIFAGRGIDQVVLLLTEPDGVGG